MTALGDPRARRTAEKGRLPTGDLVDDTDHGPATRSDRAPNCELREGHRVHAVVAKDGEDSDPVIEEVHCADPHCDYHDHPDSVEETTEINPDTTQVDGVPGYTDAACAYVVAATLLADYDGSPEDDTLTLTDVELATYHEQFSLPEA